MEWLRRFVGRRARRIGLYVDGPNVLRDAFDTDLDEVRAVAEGEGRVTAARLYLDEHATPDLLKAAEARGFEVVVTSGDVDVRLAVDAAAAVADGRVDVLVVVSRDTDFKPVLELAADRGVETLAVAPGEHGRSDALRNAAQRSRTLSAGVGTTRSRTDVVVCEQPARWPTLRHRYTGLDRRVTRWNGSEPLPRRR